MEEAQSKQQLLELPRPLTASKEAGIIHWVCQITAQQVLPQTLWWIISHLDARLQH